MYMWPYVRVKDIEGKSLDWIFENLEHAIDSQRSHYGHKDFLIVNMLYMEWYVSTGYTASKIDEISLETLQAVYLLTDHNARRVYVESILNDSSNLPNV